jgi:hypothetical protein
MPTISMFYGIIIRLFYAPEEHNPPHFHAYYQEYRATINIKEAAVIEGNLPQKQQKLVLAWAELHKDELIAEWELAMNKEPLFSIDPLK